MDDERLIVSLEARIRDFERNMAKAERRGTKSYQSLRRGSLAATTAMERDMVRSTTRINQALATTSTRIGAVGKAFAAGAVAAGVAAITTGATQAVRGMAEMEQQAKRAGLSVTAFQELKFVSEQQRIDLDAFIDGMKELQLRADEFVVTGKGPAADAFKRLGFEARDLKRQLEDPTELFLDLIDRMEGLDRAGQIRVADEVFGGTGGERFVELLAQGDEGIRRLIERSHELGVVIEEDTITRAAELDRKFAEIASRVSSLAKTGVVGLAGAIEDALTIDVDEIFGDAERAIAMMGEANYRALKGMDDLTDDTRGNVEDLIGTYDQLFASINAATGPDGIRLMDVADIEQAQDLAAILQDIDHEMRAFQNGSKSAAEFEAEVSDLVGEAQDLIAELSAVDAQRFGNVIAAINGIAGALATAAQNAASLRSQLPEGDTETTITYGPQNGRPRSTSPGTETAPRSSPRPVLPSVNADFDSPPVERPGGGSGGGGGTAQLDAYQKEIEATRRAIAQLEAEAVALAAVAESGEQFGDAIEYARTKAELLYAAQEAGKEITPELEAEIDELARSYEAAGTAAEQAAEKLEKAEENAKRGAEAMSDLFLGILDGSMSAEEALKRLLWQIIQVQLESQFLKLADSAGADSIFGVLGGLLSGERAAGGPVRGGGAYLVNERTPNSEIFVPSQSGGILNVPQAQAALRSSGSSGPAPVVNVPVTIRTDPDAKVEQRPNPNGGIDLDVWFDRKADEYFASGRANRVQRAKFGNLPKPQGN